MTLRTSEEWQKLLPNPKVLDPDGWDRANFDHSWNEEKISRQEYEDRLIQSTCTGWIHPVTEGFA